MILLFVLFEDLGHLWEIKYGLVSPKLYDNIKAEGFNLETWKLITVNGWSNLENIFCPF